MIFVYLASKWGIKRTREISNRFDTELKEMEHKGKELEETRKRIVDLKIKRNKSLEKNDVKRMKLLDKEIKELEEIKEKLLKEVDEF